MGVVYVAFRHDLRAGVALKTFQQKYLYDRELLDRFPDEGHAWLKLGFHRNIVSALWVELIQERPYRSLFFFLGSPMRSNNTS
jgi:hypothetical protein